MKLAWFFFCFLGFFVYTYNGELQGQVLEDNELTKLLMIKSIGEWLVGLTFLEVTFASEILYLIMDSINMMMFS